MAKEHIEVRVLTAVDAGELLGLLDESGCLGASEQDGAFSLYWAKENWGEETLGALQRVLRRLGDHQAADTLTTWALPDQDWNARWAASLQPIQLGRRIYVRQSWNSIAVPAGRIELVIDPKRAFGTGYHATTQLIVEWLEDCIHGCEKVLDVGTGSGILAMVALRLGATWALGIDNDPEAIECAREYAVVNGFGPELELQVAALEDLVAQKSDWLLANLDRKTLLKYFHSFHSFLQPGGVVLVSGLQRDDYQEICEALAATGWVVRGLRERDEWLALELRAQGSGIKNKGRDVGSRLPVK
jgi:ribosomal protein L11 methyltransferase